MEFPLPIEVYQVIQSEKKIEWEEAVSIGIQLREVKDNVHWELGDLARKVEKHYGEDCLGKFANGIGIPKDSLREYRRVARKIKKTARCPFLSYRHHQRAANTDHPERWLKKAEKNDWTSEQMGVEIKKSSNPKYEPQPKLKKCEECGGYYIESEYEVCKCRYVKAIRMPDLEGGGEAE